MLTHDILRHYSIDNVLTFLWTISFFIVMFLYYTFFNVRLTDYVGQEIVLDSMLIALFLSIAFTVKVDVVYISDIHHYIIIIDIEKIRTQLLNLS